MKSILVTASTVLLSFFLFINTTLTAQCHFNILFISTQNEIDSFKINNPDCNKLSGLILFDGAGIENLDGFQHIDTMAGTFVMLNCLNLINLSGLRNLKYIETLNIQGPTKYTNFEGLKNLTQITGSLRLSYISNLLSFEGLTNLNYINSVSIMYSNLTTLDELNAIDSISSIGIQYSDELVNLDLQNLTNHYSLNLLDNQNLEYINVNNTHKNANHIGLINNPRLVSLTGFENLDSIGIDFGGLELVNNPLLANLNMFNNVRYLNNLKLTNTSIGRLTFDSLTIIEDFLLLRNNARLSDCSIDPVCDKVLIEDSVNIQGNRANCAFTQRVKETCMLISVENKSLDNDITIYPNPTDGLIYFDGEDLERNAMVKIVDLNGKVVMQNQLSGLRQVNLHQLNSGVYFVHIIQENGRFSGKVVLE